MPTKLRQLKREARESASFRGHSLGNFRSTSDHSALAKCPCGAYVQVNTRPAPNGIDIGGDAVAINCPKGEIE